MYQCKILLIAFLVFVHVMYIFIDADSTVPLYNDFRVNNVILLDEYNENAQLGSRLVERLPSSAPAEKFDPGLIKI